MNHKCPVCNSDLNQEIQRTANLDQFFDCPVCGKYTCHWREAVDYIEIFKTKYPNNAPYVPHNIRLINNTNDYAVLRKELLENLYSNPIKSTVTEQADNIVLFMGEKTLGLGEKIEIDCKNQYATFGAPTPRAAVAIIKYLTEQEIIKGKLSNIVFSGSQPSQHLHSGDLHLTYKGLQRYAELQKRNTQSKTAFMAMQFADSQLDKALENCFRPSVAALGFQLRKLDDPEHQRAGLIDDRLRVEIKNARFMICDLTHNNNGAYWEAGYAEGLGKPVIYTCKESVFKERHEKGGGTHFDTNHHLHILWELDKLDEVSEKLKACIRTTIPEAHQQDSS